MSEGKLFQMRAAATEKERSPMVEWHTTGKFISEVPFKSIKSLFAACTLRVALHQSLLLSVTFETLESDLLLKVDFHSRKFLAEVDLPWALLKV